MQAFRHAVQVLTILGVVRIASADPVLFTPPLPAEDGNAVECKLVNVSTKSQQAQVQLFGSFPAVPGGDVLADSGMQTVSPANTQDLLFSVPVQGGFSDFWCKFTLVSGGKASWRGSVTVIVSNTTGWASLPAN